MSGSGRLRYAAHMFTSKTVFAFALGVVALAAAMHFLGPDAIRALGRIVHGGH